MSQEQLNEIRKQCERCREYAGDHDLIISLVDEIERLRKTFEPSLAEKNIQAELNNALCKQAQEQQALTIETCKQVYLLISKMFRQLEISDQYAAEHKKDSVLPTVWELQNGHLRDVAQEILEVVQEEEEPVKIGQLNMHCGECSLIDFCTDCEDYAFCSDKRFSDIDDTLFILIAKTATDIKPLEVCEGCERPDCDVYTYSETDYAREPCEYKGEKGDYYATQLADFVFAELKKGVK